MAHQINRQRSFIGAIVSRFAEDQTAVIGDDDLRQLILQLKEHRRAIWRRK
jgi:hypothetical protein